MAGFYYIKIPMSLNECQIRKRKKSKISYKEKKICRILYSHPFCLFNILYPAIDHISKHNAHESTD